MEACACAWTKNDGGPSREEFTVRLFPEHMTNTIRCGHTRPVIIRLAALSAALAVALAAGAAPMPIGFVDHYPMVSFQEDQVAQTGATVMIVRAPWPFIEPKEGQFDFTILDQQLKWADQQGLKLVYILEAGPTHAAGVGWLVDKLQHEGQTMGDATGKPVRDPSMFSPIYRHYLERYLHTVVGYLAHHPLRHVIYGYNNGCEWWYPMSLAHAPIDIAAYRDRLRQRYIDLAGLNHAWGTSFARWDEVSTPRLEWVGSGLIPQSYMVSAGELSDTCYCTVEGSHIPVKPGQTITLQADCIPSKPTVGGISAEIAWLDGEHPQPMKLDRAFEYPQAAGKPATVKVTAPAPPNARFAWLLAKSLGAGETHFTRISCVDDAGHELAANPDLDPAKGAWHFISWSADSPDAVTHGWTAAHDAWISYDPPRGRGYSLRQVYDWMDFRSSAVAEMLEWMAARLRETDPSRPVVTYLTFGFANPFEWDYAQQMGIALDVIARGTPSVQVLGMQIAASEGDYDSVTCAIDMVRKYGKPAWAVDLLDFTRGVALGRAGLTRISESVVQHGGQGIEYYCWHGTPIYNYTDLGVPELRRMIEGTKRWAARTDGAAVVSDVALVMPRMPLLRNLPEPANDWADFMGWYKLLVRAGVCPDVYTLEELPSSQLSRYRAIVVPDCAYAPVDALKALAAARKAGVPLVTSGRFAHRDFSAQPLGETGLPTPSRVFIDPVGAQVLGVTHRQPNPTDAPSRLVCSAGWPQPGSAAGLEAVRALQALGVRTLLVPGEAPVTAVPFRAGGSEHAFVLPDADWSGLTRVAGHEVVVPADGSWAVVPPGAGP